MARDPHHSFTPYLADLGRKLRYRAYWNPEAIPEFAAVGRVIGMSTGGAAAAVEFVVGPGRMLFLPPPERDLKGTERRPFTDALLESVERALERPDDESAPAWAKKYDLPGAAEAERHSKAAETAFAEAEASLVEARAFLADARRFQALLWRGGRFGLEPVVREAFRTLGFEVAPDLDQPAELKDGKTIALLEIDASLATVKEQAYLTLQRRIEQDFLLSGQRKKGLIVVNGQRQLDPTLRRAALADTLVNACENFGYALIPSDALYALVTFALEEKDADALATMRETILATDGLLVVEEAEDTEDTEDTDDVATSPAAAESTGPTEPTAPTAASAGNGSLAPAAENDGAGASDGASASAGAGADAAEPVAAGSGAALERDTDPA